MSRLQAFGLTYLPCFGLIVTAGCHHPNDPNVNPKAFHSLMNNEARAAISSIGLECYDEVSSRRVNPDGEPLSVRTYTIKGGASLPERITVFYSPRRRVAWHSVDQNLASDPRPATQSTSTADSSGNPQ